MGRVALVTISTDGFVDTVQVPDGSRYTLGPVSVLRLITGLVSARMARKALQEFTSTGQVMLSVDLDRMWGMLPFQRARYSSSPANPLMGLVDRPVEMENYMPKTASYDTFSANMDLAEGIVTKVAATDEIIERLKKAGKRFDSVRAKADLHRIASRVTEIAQNVDLAQPWVGTDLSDLSKRADAIHELFHPPSKTA